MNENLFIARKYLIADPEKLGHISAAYGELANKEDIEVLNRLADAIAIPKRERPSSLSRFSKLIKTIIDISLKEAAQTELTKTLNVEKLRRHMLVTWEGDIYKIHRIYMDGRIKIARPENKKDRRIVPATALKSAES